MSLGLPISFSTSPSPDQDDCHCNLFQTFSNSKTLKNRPSFQHTDSNKPLTGNKTLSFHSKKGHSFSQASSNASAGEQSQPSKISVSEFKSRLIQRGKDSLSDQGTGSNQYHGLSDNLDHLLFTNKRNPFTIDLTYNQCPRSVTQSVHFEAPPIIRTSNQPHYGAPPTFRNSNSFQQRPSLVISHRNQCQPIRLLSNHSTVSIHPPPHNPGSQPQVHFPRQQFYPQFDSVPVHQHYHNIKMDSNPLQRSFPSRSFSTNKLFKEVSFEYRSQDPSFQKQNRQETKRMSQGEALKDTYKQTRHPHDLDSHPQQHPALIFSNLQKQYSSEGCPADDQNRRQLRFFYHNQTFYNSCNTNRNVINGDSQKTPFYSSNIIDMKHLSYNKTISHQPHDHRLSAVVLNATQKLSGQSSQAPSSILSVAEPSLKQSRNNRSATVSENRPVQELKIKPQYTRSNLLKHKGKMASMDSTEYGTARKCAEEKQIYLVTSAQDYHQNTHSGKNEKVNSATDLRQQNEVAGRYSITTRNYEDKLNLSSLKDCLGQGSNNIDIKTSPNISRLEIFNEEDNHQNSIIIASENLRGDFIDEISWGAQVCGSSSKHRGPKERQHLKVRFQNQCAESPSIKILEKDMFEGLSCIKLSEENSFKSFNTVGKQHTLQNLIERSQNILSSDKYIGVGSHHLLRKKCRINTLQTIEEDSPLPKYSKADQTEHRAQKIGQTKPSETYLPIMWRKAKKCTTMYSEHEIDMIKQVPVKNCITVKLIESIDNSDEKNDDMSIALGLNHYSPAMLKAKTRLLCRNTPSSELSAKFANRGSVQYSPEISKLLLEQIKMECSQKKLPNLHSRRFMSDNITDRSNNSSSGNKQNILISVTDLPPSKIISLRNIEKRQYPQSSQTQLYYISTLEEQNEEGSNGGEKSQSSFGASPRKFVVIR